MTEPASPACTRILLVRHGQSVTNAGGRAADQVSNPLTELGRAQSREFAERFDCKPTLFVASPFLRAQQTSEPLRQRFPDVPVEEWPIQEFSFLNPALIRARVRRTANPTSSPTGSGKIPHTSTAPRPSRSLVSRSCPRSNPSTRQPETRAAASSSLLMDFSCRHSGWYCSSPTPRTRS